MTNTSTSVLIAGAGPSGLALALALLQNGMSVRIVDKCETHKIGQKGCGIQPRILELYKFMDVLPDILKKGGPIPSVIHYLPNGETKTISMARKSEDTPDKPYNNPILLGQDRHEEILREHLAKLGCEVELGTELVSFEQSADRVVSRVLKTRDGQTVEETISSRWLVGSEGARSVVRKTLGLTFLGETREGENMVVGDIKIIKPQLDEFWHFYGDMTDKTVVIRPSEDRPANKYQFFLMGHQLDATAAASGREAFLKEFYAISGRTDIEFGELVWISNFRGAQYSDGGQIRFRESFYAAHVHSPTGGQGLNSGIQDSINLAWKLVLIDKGLAAPTLLDTYTQERIPVIAAMLNKTTELLNKTFKPGASSYDGWQRGPELYQFGVNYRGSPIVVDEAGTPESVDPYRSGEGGELRAGDRAPDAPGLVSSKGEKTRLFDIFRTSYHTVLIFAGAELEAKEILDLLKAYSAGTVKSVVILPQSNGPVVDGSSADFVLTDGEGYAYKHYNGRNGVVVVRPDGMIGALVGGVDGLKQYFRGIFL
ncbi:FAD binding domain-containing protein [Desarmillaria tabescens]|uniref:FAD binding domain-containing protein n=1 Tax=Armillaria tabescens TaxID=1929756 RepID=A0AA39NJI7_ARMTA|nr:FAD binding domain-containing protein [Desarmillaria tabescens]KAK0466822.1 FAD binding domain-containing protein [Desarmillaria tabescens]